MSSHDGFDELRQEMVSWRHDLHAHPELAFEEHRTAEWVAGLLAGWGLEVTRGLGGTGVVGTLEGRETGPSIALRAELDALPIEEETGAPYASQNEGVMHACGHDGHAAMLLGAARYLSRTRDFAGTVRFIFQPAEENEGGGRAMVEDGLFERFAIDEVYGLHNWPGLEVGRLSVRSGPVTANLDLFEIRITGEGCHAAMPQNGRDPIPCAANLVSALQSVTARDVDPLRPSVLSVTQIHAGNTWNVLPDSVLLRGTVRTFDAEVRDTVERRMEELVRHVAEAHRCRGTLEYERRYPATVNADGPTRIAAEAAAAAAGKEAVVLDADPTTGAEDFAFMLEERPGCYAFIGNGMGSAPLHTPRYDFNDDALVPGARYWVTLVRQRLGAAG